MAHNQYNGLGKTVSHQCTWQGGDLFICTDGTYVWTNDNLFTYRILKAEEHQGQLKKRLPGTAHRLSKKQVLKLNPEAVQAFI